MVLPIKGLCPQPVRMNPTLRLGASQRNLLQEVQAAEELVLSLKGRGEGRLRATAKLEDNADPEPDVVLPSVKQVGWNVVKLDDAEGEAFAHVYIYTTTEGHRKTGTGQTIAVEVYTAKHGVDESGGRFAP